MGDNQQKCSSINTSSVHFQLCVFILNCQSWTGDKRIEIAHKFESLLYRVVSAECDCGVTERDIRDVSVACSESFDGGVVF